MRLYSAEQVKNEDGTMVQCGQLTISVAPIGVNQAVWHVMKIFAGLLKGIGCISIANKGFMVVEIP